MQALAVDKQPLKTLNGVNMVLELYTDHIVIRRHDSLATYLPDMFNEVRDIDLKDIAAVYLLDSKYSYSRWLILIVLLTHHKHITLLYNYKDQAQAVAIKEIIDSHIRKKQPSPLATV